MSSHRYKRGISVVEIIVSAAIIATAVTGIAGAWQLYLKVSNLGTQYAQANMLIEEASEALTIMRDTNWTNNISPLTNNTTYYLYWNGSTYTATTTQQIRNGLYVRTITFQSVSRDVNFDIAASGTVDLKTRKVFITVYPIGNASTTLAQAQLLLHNVFNN